MWLAGLEVGTGDAQRERERDICTYIHTMLQYAYLTWYMLTTRHRMHVQYLVLLYARWSSRAHTISELFIRAEILT